MWSSVSTLRNSVISIVDVSLYSPKVVTCRAYTVCSAHVSVKIRININRDVTGRRCRGRPPVAALLTFSSFCYCHLNYLGKVQHSTDDIWLFSLSTVVVHGLTVAPVFRLHQIENDLLRIWPWRTRSAWSNSCPGMYGHRMAVRIFDSLVSDGR